MRSNGRLSHFSLRMFQQRQGMARTQRKFPKDMDKTELDSYRQLCADFGIRDCWDNEQFNALLKELGEDAYNSAYLPDEDEDMGMQL